MIFRDDFGYLAERNKDGGDSAVRAGLMGIYTGKPDNLPYYVKNGVCVRHPLQFPWNNPNNFTKDQLKCLVAGLYAIGRQDLCLEIYRHHKKLGHCQSIERDKPGSIKMKRPHAFYKDSNPDATTAQMLFNWIEFKFEPDYSKLDKSHIIETKWFDCADILLPNDWLFLEVAAGLKKPSGFGLWWHHMALKQHASGDHYEENQMFAECFVLGTLRDYVTVNKLWQDRDFAYWQIRNEIEYHEMKVAFLNKTLGEW